MEIVRDSIENLAEVKADNTQCFPPIHPHRILIIEGNQVEQACFPLSESMLTSHHLSFMQ